MLSKKNQRTVALMFTLTFLRVINSSLSDLPSCVGWGAKFQAWALCCFLTGTGTASAKGFLPGPWGLSRRGPPAPTGGWSAGWVAVGAVGAPAFFRVPERQAPAGWSHMKVSRSLVLM